MQALRLNVVGTAEPQQKPTLKLKVNPIIQVEEKSLEKGTQKVTLKINPTSSNTSSNPSNPASQNSSQNDVQLVKESDYMKFNDQKDHVYRIPDTYIGNSIQADREERILDLQTMLFKKSTIRIPEGVERLFIELLSNAGDNAARSLLKGVEADEIVVTMTEKSIKVRNGGIPIPVEIHKQEKIYCPELIFGHLMSSSSYDASKKRQFSSRNGFGAKLTNIFSKEFKVTVADPYNELMYQKTWRNNMKENSNHEITPYPKTGKGFVEIEYTMDFERFGYQSYPQEAFELYARHAVDTAFTLKIPVSFNGHKFNISSAKEYAKLYLGKDAVKSSILYYVWPPGTETVMKKNVEYAVKKGVLPLMEICAVDSADSAEKVSFVNNMWTRNGGVHYEAAFKAVTSGILKTVNEGNGGKKNKKNDKAPKLTLSDVKKHVSLFVNCWIEDPIFDSQSKNELKAPTPKVVIDEKILNNINKWELVSRLYAELEAKMFRAASKTDGKKKKHIGMEKLTDANKAGTNESVNCSLYVTEGDSALTYAYKLSRFFPNDVGPDYIGLMPLRGKPLNVMNAPALQIAENKEIKALKKVLGLREGIDYTIDENFHTLRYGHLLCLCDSDQDGKHILGLLMNLFHCKYPSLLARGFLKYLRTKVMEVKKGNRVFTFYSQHEYEEWKLKNPDFQSWKHAYFKGLGSSNTASIEAESKNPKFVMSVYDVMAPESLKLAFDIKMSDKRKEWISSWQPDYTVETMKVQPISAFINHEFIQYSIADLARSIPRFTDGLKVSQRKVLWTALKRWGDKAGNAAEILKTAQFASIVSEKTAYMHGEKSLEGTIIGMAQDFVGSNNLPYFDREGEMGTRRMLGEDKSSGRYSHTRPEPYIPFIFRKEDIPILKILIEEGQEIEPVTLLPIIPMHLVNGILGIGSGSSTFMPAHNVLDIVYWIEAKIKGLPTPKLIPWYRGFTGEIELVEKGRKQREKEEEEREDDMEDDKEEHIEEEEDEERRKQEDKDEILIHKKTRMTLVTKGCFEDSGTKKEGITITEIPIGRAIDSYKGFLDKMKEEKVIKDYDNYSTTDVPKFIVYGMKEPTLKSLKLIKSYGMSNMVCLDDSNRPVKFENASMVMETFYSIRLAYYVKRKENMLQEIATRINGLNARIKFILAVIKGYELIKENPNIADEEANSKEGVLVLGRNRKDIVMQLERCGVSDDLYKKITLHNCTVEEVQVSRDKIAELENERNIKEKTKPEDLWLNDLQEFVKVYCKHYKCKYQPPKKLTLKIIQ